METKVSPNKRKVCLILPPNLPLANPVLQPPLGPLYVAAALEKAGHEVEFLDLRDKPLDEAVKLLIPEADYYGITATTAEFPDAQDLARLIIRMYPEANTVVGGVHATLRAHLDRDDFSMFDYVVVGEGERAMVDIVEGKHQPGIVEYLQPLEINSIPFPARHLLPEDRVFSSELFFGTRYYHGEKKKCTSIISARGCFWGKCAFCGNPPWLRGRGIRLRSVENVIREVKQLQDRWGCEALRWDDDNLILSKDRFIDLCEELMQFGMLHRAHTRSNLWDREMAEAAKKAGFTEMAFGIETADDEILAKLNKGETVEDHRRAIKITKDAGMAAKVYLMVGLPYETWDTIDKLKRFMDEIWPVKWTISMFQPYPGCDIYNNPEKYSIKILNSDFRRWWLYNESNIETAVASNAELNEHYRNLYDYLKSDEWRK